MNRWEKFDYLRHGVEDLRRKFAGGHPLDNVVVEYAKEGTNPLQSDCYNCEKDLVRMDGAAFGTLVYVTVPLYVRGCPVEPHGLKLAFRMTSNTQVGAENEAGEKTTTPRWKWQANLTLNDSKQWCSFYPGISKRNPHRMERNPRRIDRLDDLNEFLYDHMGEKHQAAPPSSPAV
jgi:hypothetical protein